MKLPKSLHLMAVLALMVGLALPASALAEAPKKKDTAGENAGSGKKGAAKKKGSCKKQAAGKRKGSCKKSSGKKKNAGKKAPGSEASAPDCTGAAAGSNQCYIDVIVRQGSPTTGAICDSFDNGSGVCLGSSGGTPGWRQSGWFPKQGIGTWFSWDHGNPRDVEYLVKATFTITEAVIRGNVPNGGSATFNVTEAYNRSIPGRWKTVSTGGAPGAPGGPLYIDYEHSFVGSEVHMWGYLVRQ